MAKTYQGKSVTVERTAKQGDNGFDQSKDQVVIKMPDGSHVVVLRTEVKDGY